MPQIGIMLLKYLGFSCSKNASSSKEHYSTVIEELCHHLSLKDLRKSTNNFDKKLVIDERDFGKVYKGCLKYNGATDYTITLKRWKSNFYQVIPAFVQEIELLCQLRHPNLITLIGFCNHEKEKIIVYEYMRNGSLQDRLNNRDKEALSWKKRLEICIGAARGVHYLHTGAKRTIFHRDIKPSNIFLDNKMVPKLFDFGLCLQGPLSTSKPKPIAVDVVGTYGYAAPEYVATGEVTDKCDVYSFGMVLVQVVCTKDREIFINKANMQPNQDGSKSATANEYSGGSLDDPTHPERMKEFMQQFPVEEIIDPILKGKIAPECWEVFIDITRRCLKSEPDERPTIGEVEVLLEHALSVQEETDIRNTNGDYALLSTTMIFEPPICRDDQESDDNTSGDYSS